MRNYAMYDCLLNILVAAEIYPKINAQCLTEPCTIPLFDMRIYTISLLIMRSIT